MNECPYAKTLKNAQKFNEDCSKLINEKEEMAKCPYMSNKSKEEKPKNSVNEVDSDDEQPRGGCPVMNKVKKDPPNKHFEPHFEIPYFGPFDFIFNLTGGLKQKEFNEKTAKLQKYSRQLKYTLFSHNDENLKKVREKEFPIVFFVYDDVKDKANKLFKKNKFREAIRYYQYCYSTLKWIEFKDASKNADFLTTPSLDPVLDENLVEKRPLVEGPVVEDSYKACVVYVLMCLSYAYMELRHYSEAIDCINEAFEYAGDKVPDLFFRRAQAVAYNKFSSEEELEEAKNDVIKAMKLKEQKKENEPIYQEFLTKLNELKANKKAEEMNKITSLLRRAKYSFDKAKEKNFSIDNFFLQDSKDSITQYKILTEMRNKYISAVKFFSDSKNEEQLDLSYKENEQFMENYMKFQWYFTFNIEDLSDEQYNQLSDDYKNLLKNPEVPHLINSYKYKESEDIFSNGNYNFDLYKYALEKIFSDEAKEKEEEEERNNPPQASTSFLQSIFSTKFSFLLTICMIVFSLSLLGIHYKMYSSGTPHTSFK